MKKLIVIIGPNAVGKSTTAKMFLEKSEKCAYVDSDWCREITPFALTKSTKKAVTENIYCLLRNFLRCDDIETVIFTYSWHGVRKEIYETVMTKLKNDKLIFQETIIVLKCSLDENIKRAKEDGRDEVRLKRGIENTFLFYEEYDYPCIDTTRLSPEQVVQKIQEIVK